MGVGGEGGLSLPRGWGKGSATIHKNSGVWRKLINLKRLLQRGEREGLKAGWRMGLGKNDRKG